MNEKKRNETEHIYKIKIDGLVRIVHSYRFRYVYVYEYYTQFGSVTLAYPCDSNELITSVPTYQHCTIL